MRTRRFVFGLALVLALAFMMGIPLAANATATVPNTLSGIVYDLSTGSPMPGIEVRLYDAATAWGSDTTPASIATTVTAADGSYTITGIDGNAYTIIAFVDLTDTYRDNTAPSRGWHITDSWGWRPDSLDSADGYMYPLSALEAGRTYRVAGPDRYSTAAAISAANYPSSSWVIIANGNAFADSLSAAGLAGYLDCPLLLVTNDTIPNTVRAELQDLGATDAVIVGGPVSVTSKVVTSLSGMGISSVRITGNDRYQVSANVANTVYANAYVGDPSSFPGFYVCRGDVFADALSVSPFAYDEIAPILLTDPRGLSDSAKAVFNGITTHSGVDIVAAVGGKVSVPDAILQELADNSGTGSISYSRLSGPDRYSTGRDVVETHLDWYNMKGFDTLGVASGEVFPDALAGGMALGHWDGALILTPGAKLGSDARSVLQNSGPYAIDVQVYGGTKTLTPTTASAVDAALGSAVYDMDGVGERVVLTGITSIAGGDFSPRRGFGPPTLPMEAAESAPAPSTGMVGEHSLEAAK